jgi:ABC-2 type transport system ATP-binding protein
LARVPSSAAAIVDRGRVVIQGSIDELAGGDARHELRIEVDDPARAFLVLDGHPLVRDLRHSEDGLRAVLAGGPETAIEVNARLVHTGIGVLRMEPVRHTLEQRFLQITTRLDAAPEEVAA